jgi:hypothetical protein
MASLSISSVMAEAGKIQPGLKLVRKADHFEWHLDQGDKVAIQRIEVNQIRGLKLDQWLAHARALVAGEPIAGAPPPVTDVPKAQANPADKVFEPMPKFMLISNKQPVVPFKDNAFDQGYSDATRGITACPYGLGVSIRDWNRGHDQAIKDGMADKPRFGLTAGSRR